jgi:Uma2 family endonuclease
MDEKFLRAEELGIRLEIANGLPIWEASPVYRHQEAVDRIRGTITPLNQADVNSNQCKCIHAADVYVSFPNGSLKRPDIAIFCRELAEEEKDDAIKIVPEAVIEVVSRGYEAKDLEIGPAFYLSQGVKDIIIFDPYTLLVMHIRRGGTKRLVSPVEVLLECGCKCVV